MKISSKKKKRVDKIQQDIKKRLDIDDGSFYAVGRAVRKEIAEKAKTIATEADVFELCSIIVDGLWLLKENGQPYIYFYRPLKTHVAAKFWEETKEIFSKIVAEAKIGKTKKEVLEDFAELDKKREFPVLIGNCTIAPVRAAIV